MHNLHRFNATTHPDRWHAIPWELPWELARGPVGFPTINPTGLIAGSPKSHEIPGSFAVVGRQKSLFPGALISPNSLFCFARIACNFEICAAHRRPLLCCKKQQHKTPRAQQHTSLLAPCAHGKLNVKLYRTTPKPETHITRQVVENEAALWRENRKLSTKKTCMYRSGTATITRHTTASNTLLGVTCTSMSASCCCWCRSVLLLL